MPQAVFARLQDGHSRTLRVVKDGRLPGLLTADHFAEVLVIQEGPREASRPPCSAGLARLASRGFEPAMRPAVSKTSSGRSINSRRAFWAESRLGGR
jgi:hypothetical protein